MIINGIVGFRHDGVWITNPYTDAVGQPVDPVAHYGFVADKSAHGWSVLRKSISDGLSITISHSNRIKSPTNTEPRNILVSFMEGETVLRENTLQAAIDANVAPDIKINAYVEGDTFCETVDITVRGIMRHNFPDATTDPLETWNALSWQEKQSMAEDFTLWTFNNGKMVDEPNYAPFVQLGCLPEDEPSSEVPA